MSSCQARRSRNIGGARRTLVLVADLAQLARDHSDATAEQVAHLRALVADWGLIADLSFSDLVLWLPTWNGGGYVAAAHRRPDTGRTLFSEDVIGDFVPKGRRPHMDRALVTALPTSAPLPAGAGDVQVYPLHSDGRVIALVARYRAAGGDRVPGRLELAYQEAADELSAMMITGDFPIPERDSTHQLRVGGGFIRLDPSGQVVFATPNATSAFRRLGVAVDIEGTSLGRLAARIHDRADGSDPQVARVASGRVAGQVEIVHAGTTVMLESVPLRRGGSSTGAVILVRDVSELRSRERALVTTEASLRELHHRVKNNLQMVAALLRLQSRRVNSAEARTALAEAGQRIGAIAVVHEILSAAPQDEVDLDLVVDRVIDLARDLAPSAQVRKDGLLGGMDSDVAGPVAMCLAELVGNALEHGGEDVAVTLFCRRSPSALSIRVVDNGPGIPADMDPATEGGLGLQIVRTLVAENGGQVTWERPSDGGSVVEIAFPLGVNGNVL